MDKLTREEVLHVARLARIQVSDEEIEKYQITLKQLLDDVDKIKEMDSLDTKELVTPVSEESSLREDEVGEMIPFSEFKGNVPHSVGNFIEVPVMINE
ncbi:MAG TPA: Asp-tRNA(Asn)/Glu-tRNA(Gln) amidotransferase subunit GatC [Candidatus Pelethosoma merdigallinarum]|nr:Asp-tRNA(Asn)/Glu-tRNA(Gln) amidotransferase subunit GatC [Candidatus Pelethosoma merdigallinarum]